MLNQLPFWQGRYEQNSNIARAKNDKPWVEVGSISAALSCLVYPPREETREFGGGARAPFTNSGW